MQTGSDTHADRSEAGSASGAPVIARALSPWVRGARRAVRVVRLGLLSVEMLLWGLFFLAAGAFLGLRYWLLPNVDRFHDRIVAAASAAVGQTLTVESISAVLDAKGG